MKKCILLLLTFCVFLGHTFILALADHDDHQERRRDRKRYRNHHENYSKDHLKPVDNETYKKECGACHFAYQPELLPSGSWHKILIGLEDHFGDVIELSLDAKKLIAEYLRVNAAENSSAEQAAKIMRCLGGQTPIRITEIAYIQRKHREISTEVLKRDSIGSLSNCSACHTTAERGIYDDDHVTIPR